MASSMSMSPSLPAYCSATLASPAKGCPARAIAVLLGDHGRQVVHRIMQPIEDHRQAGDRAAVRLGDRPVVDTSRKGSSASCWM